MVKATYQTAEEYDVEDEEGDEVGNKRERENERKEFGFY